MKDLIKLKNALRGGLIVSCQALPDEPMFGRGIMAKFAKAAELGGAVGIRALAGDIPSIKRAVKLPIIGLVKRNYPDSEIYITPTKSTVDWVIESGADIIAIDATLRPRPNGETLEELVSYARSKGALLMADTSDEREAENAVQLGFDFVGTTMRGYTPYTKGATLPDLDFLRRITQIPGITVVAEGGISEPSQLAAAFEAGAFTAVVGGAITRPLSITKRFVAALPTTE